MTKIFDCPHCGLPLPMCSCSYPEAVYYPIEKPRLDVTIKRQVSPEEGMSDYDRSKIFIESYLYGHEGTLLPFRRGQGGDTHGSLISKKKRYFYGTVDTS